MNVAKRSRWVEEYEAEREDTEHTIAQLQNYITELENQINNVRRFAVSEFNVEQKMRNNIQQSQIVNANTKNLERDLKEMEQNNQQLHIQLIQMQQHRDDQVKLVLRLQNEMKELETRFKNVEQNLQSCEQEKNQIKTRYLEPYPPNNARRPADVMIRNILEPFLNSLPTTTIKKSFLLQLQKVIAPDKCSWSKDYQSGLRNAFPAFTPQLQLLEQNFVLVPELCHELFIWVQNKKSQLV